MSRVLYAGASEGELLALDEPLSFWGGVDPDTGRIIAARHPQVGADIAGRVLALPATIGSSSSSSVLLELIRGGRAPAAILMGAADAILLIGCLVGRELGYASPLLLELPADRIAALAPGRYRVDTDGTLTRREA